MPCRNSENTAGTDQVTNDKPRLKMLEQADELTKTIATGTHGTASCNRSRHPPRLVGATKQIQPIYQRSSEITRGLDDFVRPLRQLCYWEPALFDNHRVLVQRAVFDTLDGIDKVTETFLPRQLQRRLERHAASVGDSPPTTSR